jgi:predicted GNAT family acetyltransferase
MSLKVHDIANSAAKKLYEKLGFKKIGKDLESGMIDFKKVL